MSDPDAPDWGTDDPVDPAALMMATPQLLELARAVRGTSWSTRLGAALEAARVGGWDWGSRAKFAAALIFTSGADPSSLTDAARPAVKPAGVPPSPPDAASRGAELARRLLAEKAAGRHLGDRDGWDETS